MISKLDFSNFLQVVKVKPLPRIYLVPVFLCGLIFQQDNFLLFIIITDPSYGAHRGMLC